MKKINGHKLQNAHIDRWRARERNGGKRIEGDLDIDYDCFKKSPHEKELLKVMKANMKQKQQY